MQAHYKHSEFQIQELLDSIDRGGIALPELQRLFVWKKSQVRDLFDSLYKGYPIGSLLLWNMHDRNEISKHINQNIKEKSAYTLIIDGQQRLTSLYAVIKNKEVKHKDSETIKIEIAFKPSKGKFEVSNASHKKDPLWIHDISELFTSPLQDSLDIADEFVSKIQDPSIDTNSIRKNIIKLLGLKNTKIYAIELSEQIEMDIVSDIFVRINNQGKSLTNSDFILTLMSLHWNEGRKELEDFCYQCKKPFSAHDKTPANKWFAPQIEQMIRIIIGYGLKRAKLQYGYALLIGKNLEERNSFETHEVLREKQLAKFKQAQSIVLNLTYWHDFMNCILVAGFQNQQMIQSKTTIAYCYIFYLLGRIDYKIPESTLRPLIARYFFMANITERYSSSFESTMEKELNKIKEIDLSQASEWIHFLKNEIDLQLHDNFWNITLPEKLETRSTTSPAWNSFIAAQTLLDSKTLCSSLSIKDLINKDNSTRKSLEKHHLFPKAYLKRKGIVKESEYNQVANFTYLEWQDNNKISDQSPQEYITMLPNTIQGNYGTHALWIGWEQLSYNDFLIKRRKHMSSIIKEGFDSIQY